MQADRGGGAEEAAVTVVIRGGHAGYASGYSGYTSGYTGYASG